MIGAAEAVLSTKGRGSEFEARTPRVGSATQDGRRAPRAAQLDEACSDRGGSPSAKQIQDGVDALDFPESPLPSPESRLS
jgi:hypothetical protein